MPFIISCAERAGPTLCVRRRSLWASGFLCMHKTVRGARECTRQKDASHAQSALDTRTRARHTQSTSGTHAWHALRFRRRRSSAPLAHRERTPSVLLTYVQRTQRSSSVFVCVACTQSVAMGYTPQKMDDPDRLRIQYEIAVLQHQQNLVELGLHQVDVIGRRRKRRGHRRLWVQSWIGGRRQYDQLLVEDQASFKNFMQMPPEMFDELLTRVGPRITKQNTDNLQRGPRLV